MTILMQSLSQRNNPLIRKLGLTNTIMLQYLLSIRDNVSHTIDKFGYFPTRLETASYDTGLSDVQIKGAITALIDLNIIKCKTHTDISYDHIEPIMCYYIDDREVMRLQGFLVRNILPNKRYELLAFPLSWARHYAMQKHFNKAIRYRKYHDKVENEIINQKKVIPIARKNNLVFITNNDKYFSFITKIRKKRKKPVIKKDTLLDKLDYYKTGIERERHVFTTIEEHEMLCNRYGEDRVKKAYTILSEFLDRKGGEYRNKAMFAIQSWVMREVMRNE